MTLSHVNIYLLEEMLDYHPAKRMYIHTLAISQSTRHCVVVIIRSSWTQHIDLPFDVSAFASNLQCSHNVN